MRARILALLLFAAPATAQVGSVVVINDSSWDIYQLYLSPSHRFLWGPDRLGLDVLETGERIRIRDVPCGLYDVRLVDEDGDACVVYGVRVCGKRTEWVIRDDELLACQWLTFE